MAKKLNTEELENIQGLLNREIKRVVSKRKRFRR